MVDDDVVNPALAEERRPMPSGGWPSRRPNVTRSLQSATRFQAAVAARNRDAVRRSLADDVGFFFPVALRIVRRPRGRGRVGALCRPLGKAIVEAIPGR